MKVTQLSGYSVISDTNQYAQQVRTTAHTEVQAQLARTQQEADALRTAAEVEAQALVYRARQEASGLWITVTQELVAACAEGKQLQEQAG